MKPITKLSPKQKLVLKWAHLTKFKNRKAIICDGSVRSGKTVSMILGFVHWAMRFFDGKNFGICGKTISSTERNIILPLLNMPDITDYYSLQYIRGENKRIIVRSGSHTNTFFIFGGKDESSYTLVQGITLSGVLFDEVALMPKSFVDQAVARTLSEPEARYWFNCNPESAEHWFYKEWICNTRQKKALHLHFTMQDNPILSPEQIADAERLYTGVFYNRYIKGLWCVAEGLIYPMFDKAVHVTHHPELQPGGDYYISCDYGTLNPTSAGLWYLQPDGHAIRLREYYYDGRKTKTPRTDEEHYAALEQLAGDVADKVRAVIVDPSAASFIECIRRHGLFRVWQADNSVLNGIRDTSSLLQMQYLHICDNCTDIIREFSLYRWDESAAEDRPIKENDHAMDDMRYFVRTAMTRTLKTIRRR
ncbi:MAG TPA: PBSX family phage terminase large subunit [Ruminococcus sp.]|nr:MAG TPA: large terminase [Caudoviricetes sp.]HAI78332.1 PBSX family phage terminase large subunit [Ruminococcus sp.]HCW13212.1 PBSX family phage terminase large subunit [Ruminococcus sp.]